MHVLFIKCGASPSFAIPQTSDSDSVSVSKTPLEVNFSHLLWVDGRRNWLAKIWSENWDTAETQSYFLK